MVRAYVRDPDVLWLTDMIIDSTENPGIPRIGQIRVKT